jgi:hypothetical protein
VVSLAQDIFALPGKWPPILRRLQGGEKICSSTS